MSHYKNTPNKLNQLASLSRMGGLVGLATLALGATSLGHAEPTGYNQISFSAEANAQVENDELNASMYIKEQADTPALLATALNQKINAAMEIAKRYPSVEVTTGGQHTYPRYAEGRDNTIVGWTGQSGIQIKSTDIEAASRLIADLQGVLVMENLSFGVSDAKRKLIEQQLMTEASRAFQVQAESLAQAWSATGYRVLSVSLGTNGYYPQPMMMNASRASVEMPSLPQMEFQSGDSTLTVTANGSIELVQ